MHRLLACAGAAARTARHEEDVTRPDSRLVQRRAELAPRLREKVGIPLND
jgi:hypothetical protein